MALALCVAPAGRAQDAATEEKLRQLRGRVEDLTAGQDALSKRLEDLARQVESLRQDQSRPQPNFAGLDDLKRLAKAIEEDRDRIDNLEKIRTELKQIYEIIKRPPPERVSHGPTPTPGARRHDQTPDTGSTEEKGGGGTEAGFEYRVRSGDTMARIAARYQAQGVKVTADQIAKANPKVKPESLRVGAKLFIPKPQ